MHTEKILKKVSRPVTRAALETRKMLHQLYTCQH